MQAGGSTVYLPESSKLCWEYFELSKKLFDLCVKEMQVKTGGGDSCTLSLYTISLVITLNIKWSLSYQEKDCNASRLKQRLCGFSAVYHQFPLCSFQEYSDQNMMDSFRFSPHLQSLSAAPTEVFIRTRLCGR